MRTLVAMSLMFGTPFVEEKGKVHALDDKHIKRPKVHEPKVRTEEEKAIKKAHKKSIKARRNAKKGIYETKITYKKGRKQC